MALMLRFALMIFVLMLPTSAVRAEEAPADSRYYLAARDGRQCQLQTNVQEETARELTRFKMEQQYVHTDGIWISWMLRSDHLPEGCVPSDAEAFFDKFPWASAVTAPRSHRCEACGCPETWFYCVLSDSPPEELKALGYAPLYRQLQPY